MKSYLPKQAPNIVTYKKDSFWRRQICLLNLCLWRFLKDRTEESRCKYKKQRNVCVYLLKNDRKDCYENIYSSSLTDSNKFWKTLKPIFGSKIKSKNWFTLAEGIKFIQEEGVLAKTFNEFFVSITKNRGINENVSSSETRKEEM